MSYPINFPGMTKFQQKNGAKGVTGSTGIIPFNKNASNPLVPSSENFFRKR